MLSFILHNVSFPVQRLFGMVWMLDPHPIHLSVPQKSLWLGLCLSLTFHVPVILSMDSLRLFGLKSWAPPHLTHPPTPPSSKAFCFIPTLKSNASHPDPGIITRNRNPLTTPVRVQKGGWCPYFRRCEG